MSDSPKFFPTRILPYIRKTKENNGWKEPQQFYATTDLKCTRKNFNEMINMFWSVTHMYVHTLLASRHTVICQQPRKLCDAQVCYLHEPLIRCFNF